MDLGFAGGLGAGTGLAELLDELGGFEVEAFDGVIGAATFDGRPIDDGGGGVATGIAEIRLLVDFIRTGTSLTISQELGRSEPCALDAIDDVDEAKFDGIGHGDAVVEVPGTEGIFDF